MASHADEMFPGFQNPAIYTYIPSDVPQDLRTMKSRYARLESRLSPDGKEAWFNWVLRLKSTVQFDMPCIGFIQATLSLQEKTALIAYGLFPEFWRQGYAKEALISMLDHLFSQYDVTTIEALIDTRNKASQALLATVNFQQVAFLPQADFFKGENSDEYRYRLERP